MGCHPNPIDELIFFKMVKLQHQPVVFRIWHRFCQVYTRGGTMDYEHDTPTAPCGPAPRFPEIRWFCGIKRSGVFYFMAWEGAPTRENCIEILTWVWSPSFSVDIHVSFCGKVGMIITNLAIWIGTLFGYMTQPPKRWTKHLYLVIYR